jgi:hypothetical protein
VTALSWIEPNVDKMITLAGGERKIDETGKHWKVTFFPWMRVLIGVLIFLGGFTFGDMFDDRRTGGDIARYLFAGFGLLIIGQALLRIIAERRDRFVITNQRIFRVWGVFHTKRVSVPLLRILDMTVDKPTLGRFLGYGHFHFKSAAEVEGLSMIDHVPNIDRMEDVLRMVMTGQRPDILIEPDQPEDDT